MNTTDLTAIIVNLSDLNPERAAEKLSTTPGVTLKALAQAGKDLDVLVRSKGKKIAACRIIVNALRAKDAAEPNLLDSMVKDATPAPAGTQDYVTATAADSKPREELRQAEEAAALDAAGRANTPNHGIWTTDLDIARAAAEKLATETGDGGHFVPDDSTPRGPLPPAVAAQIEAGQKRDAEQAETAQPTAQPHKWSAGLATVTCHDGESMDLPTSLAGMSIEAVQDLHLAITGRPTTAVKSGNIAWAIRKFLRGETSGPRKPSKATQMKSLIRDLANLRSEPSDKPEAERINDLLHRARELAL